MSFETGLSHIICWIAYVPSDFAYLKLSVFLASLLRYPLRSSSTLSNGEPFESSPRCGRASPLQNRTGRIPVHMIYNILHAQRIQRILYSTLIAWKWSGLIRTASILCTSDVDQSIWRSTKKAIDAEHKYAVLICPFVRKTQKVPREIAERSSAFQYTTYVVQCCIAPVSVWYRGWDIQST